jgi:hypothetical protein
MGSCLVVLMSIGTAIAAGAAGPGVRVVRGPTAIPQGDARAAGDITVSNDRLAFALAVESAVPYGVPRGALIDLAPVVNGKIGRDCVVFADFIPDNWSAWPNTYRHVDMLQVGPQRAVIRVVRDWGKVTITTIYTLEAHADSVQMKTTLRNDGAVALPGLLSGMTLWPRRGFLFAVPGMAGIVQGPIDPAFAHRVVAYDEDFSVTLHAPYADTVGDGSMDLYLRHALQPGETRVFEATLQVGASGDLQPVIRQDIEQARLAFGTLHGAVRSAPDASADPARGDGNSKSNSGNSKSNSGNSKSNSGNSKSNSGDSNSNSNGGSIEQPVIIVQKGGKPYGWILGRTGQYTATLPAGEFELYATARNYSQSDPVRVQIKAGADATLDFQGLRKPGAVHFTVTDAQQGAPLDAHVGIARGQVPVVQFLGRKTFFTELDRPGEVEVPIAPGEYLFNVSAGGGFSSRVEQAAVSVAPGQTAVAKVTIARLFNPAAQHWYSADLHHHADQAEAVTPPADLARSQLAAGLDILFVSDHDSTVNHRALQSIGEHRGVVFVPGIELSPSWGHFNAYPWRLGETLAIDTGTASVEAIFAEARRHGATIIQVNHPWIPYGYFASISGGVAPGGFDPAFDLIEINAAAPGDDEKVLRTAWNYWNGGHHYYLSGGTDTHDVWLDESGSVRVYAYVDGAVSAETFAQSLKAGHAYVTSGPLILPSVMFGDTLKVKPGAPFALGFDLQAVAGVARVDLICNGTILKAQTFAAAPLSTHVDFPLSTPRSAWYSLTVVDAQGHKAYTDPIWVDTVEFEDGRSPPPDG